MDFKLNDDDAAIIASKYQLEEVDEQTPEQIAAAEEAAATAAAEAEAAKLAAEKANQGTEDGNEDGDGDGDEPTPISHLIKQYGYKAEDFADIDVKDDSVDGIKKFFDKRDVLVKEAAKKELLSEDPDIEDLIAHKQQGLSIESWKAKKEAEQFKLEFAADDVEGKADFLTKVYVNRGIPEKRAKLIVEGIKDDNELDTEVGKETEVIKVAIKQQADARIIAEQVAVKKEQDEINETVTKVNSIIKEGNLDNLVIPDTERKAFNEFVLSEKLVEKHEKLTLQQRLFIDYLVYKDFKVKGIEKVVAKAAAGTPRVKMTPTAGESGGAGDKEWKSLDELKKAIYSKTQ
jgi:hypothetical protein